MIRYWTKVIYVALCLAVVLGCTAAHAVNPVKNFSFEDYTSDWMLYTYGPSTDGDGVLPSAGCVGPTGCWFSLLPPLTMPDGIKVCGIESNGDFGSGGVCQTIYWGGEAATILVTARAYSEKFPVDGGGPYDNGCRVRIGIVPEATADRKKVTSWVTFQWGDAWSSRLLSVDGPGVYTLFIEAYEPNSNAIMSILWDNVVWTAVPPVNITVNPDATVPGNQNNPDSTARITWTTDVPSTSKVEYGLNSGYGSVVEDSQLTTQHSVLLTNLQHTSTYFYCVTSTAPDRIPRTSDEYSFVLPIQFSGISISPNFDAVGYIIQWTTDVPTTTLLEYGLNTAYGSWSTEDTLLTEEHQVILTGLQEDKTYHFRVWGHNHPNYTNANSEDQMFFSVPAPGDSLRNGSFEPAGGQNSSLYPWVQYTTVIEGLPRLPIDGIVGPYPSNGPLTWDAGIKAYQDSYFVGAASYQSTKNGGVLQRVRATPGKVITLGARFATHRVDGTVNDLVVRLGVDPSGGLNPQSTNVVWHKAYSPSNDYQWHSTGVTAIAGVSGIVTVFVDIQQLWPNTEMIAAVDDVKLGGLDTMKIGELKQSQGVPGAVIEDVIVTHVRNNVSFNHTNYTLAYVADQNSRAGIGVLMDWRGKDPAQIGNKLTVAGSLVLNDMEAMVVALAWTNDNQTHNLPGPLSMAQKFLGGSALNQPALAMHNGACNVGSRVRVCGKVTWTEYQDMSFNKCFVYLDDGTKILDHQPEYGYDPVYGVRALLSDVYTRTLKIGDYIAATGVLTLPFVDLDGYPLTGDEFNAYCVVTNDKDDWDILHVAP